MSDLLDSWAGMAADIFDELTVGKPEASTCVINCTDMLTTNGYIIQIIKTPKVLSRSELCAALSMPTGPQLTLVPKDDN